jgi:hypothetical protein
MMEQDSGATGQIATALKCELAGEVLRSFGSLQFAATGWSMLPSVWPGDTLVVDCVGKDQVHLGDIVLVGRNGRLCAHRLISKTEDSGVTRWLTQGDAMSTPDRPVLEDELLGRVSYLVRAGKLIAVTTQLSMLKRLTAKIASRSAPTARALVYLHRMLHTPKKLAPKETLSCQD